jgi:hypothetical protein
MRFGGRAFDAEQVGSKHQHDDLMSGPHEDVEKENERLRKKVRLLREDREVLKKGVNPPTGRVMRSMIPRGFFAGQSPLSCM